MRTARLNGERRTATRLPSSPTAKVLLGLLVISLCSAGCRNKDVLENELRVRDFQYRDLLDDLKKSEFHNDSLQREIEAMRKGSPVTPEQAAQTFGLKRIALSWLTKGVDNGKFPGDEALQVIVEPRDVEDHIIKVPGTVQITAQEVTSQGTKITIGTWDISQDQVRRSWKQGLFGTGYYFTLPWQSWPQHEEIRVTARFVLSDNRVFEADKDVKIRLVPRDLLPRPTPMSTEPPGATSESKRAPLVPATPPRSPAPRSGWQPVPLGESIEITDPQVLE